MKKTCIGLAALTCGFGFMLTGCKSSSTNVSEKHIYHNLTPELRGISDTPGEMSRDYHVSANQQWRMFWDDFNRFMYLDNPSRLSPYPIISATGNPR